MSEALTTSAGRLTLASPDALLASIPHLIGFPPEDSVVLVGIAPDASNRSSVRLTQRFDRTDTDTPAGALTQMARQTAGPMITAGCTEVIITVFGDQRPDPDRELPDGQLVDALITALDEGDVSIRDALYTDGTSRWSYGCDDPSCCPPEGRPIPDEVRGLVAAEFAVAGVAMVPSRDALAAELAPADVDTRDAMAREIVSARAEREAAFHTEGATGRSVEASGLEAWRDTSIATVARLSDPDPLTAADSARVAVGLGDIRVRDTALWDLAQPGVDRQSAIAGLASIVRQAPAGRVAPAATVLAICHWTSGDGARANVALEHAFADDPDYSLARLVGTGLHAGLPPQAWTDSLAGLSREVCRHGETPFAPGTEAPAAAPPARPRASIASPGLA
jgi:hypothetical protein